MGKDFKTISNTDSTTTKQTWPVWGMSCAACATSVESILQTQPGVVEASVNFANNSVLVAYQPDLTTPQKLKAALQTIGYDLLLNDSDAGEPSLEARQTEQTQKLKTKTVGAMLLSLPVLIIGMFFMHMPYANYIMWVLSTPVVLYFGKDFFINAWKQAKHGSTNMDTLVAMSTGVAYIFSVFNTFFPSYWHARGLHADMYYEAAAVVIAFILLGKLLEERAKGQTSSAIKKLMGLQPQTVTLLDANGHTTEVPIATVKPNDVLLVKPGEKIAVDGQVLNGTTYIDESTLNGEPVPVLKQTNDLVFAGTINQKSSFTFQAEKVGGDTLLAQIIRTVQDAQGSKAPVQKLADRIAKVFVPTVLAIAALTLVLWWLLGGENGFNHGLWAMVTVLVIACPCALGLATPTAIMVGVGKGAEQGILIKDAESLERAQFIKAIVLDKTGTITEGKPQVTDLIWLNDQAAAQAGILMGMEQQSEHPLAEAVVKHLEGTQAITVEQFTSITGQGAQALANGITYWVGNRKLLEANQVHIADNLLGEAQKLSAKAQTVIWFADPQQALAVVGIADPVKATSAAAIRQLGQMGINVYMLTGDNMATAQAIAQQIGIKHFEAEVLPQQKADFIKKLQAEGKQVAMVGDGINDSTALAQADVSIAMGQGSDIAMDVAKMTIISSDLSKIATAIKLSRQTVATIRQNLFWAFVYNIIGIPIAAGLLYPFTGFLLNPMIAGAAMALSSVSVVSNSLRLKWRKN